MKVLRAFFCPFLALWFWQRTAVPPESRWPDDLPRFAAGPATCAYTPSDGAVFTHVTVPLPMQAAQTAVIRSFSETGWKHLSIRATDLLIFTHGDAVAAVYTAEAGAGTRVTVIQRRNGLTAKADVGGMSAAEPLKASAHPVERR